MAFDVLYADGRSLMADPYDARRARLEQFEFAGANFSTTECFRDVSGRDVLRAITENGLEGVVAKRRNSTYRPGRRVAEWVKVKVVNTQEVVIGGWTDGKGGRGASLGSLLLGVPGSNGLDYVGKVGTGFDDRALQSIVEQLRALRSPNQSFRRHHHAKPRPKVRTSSVPAWSARSRYGEWTPAGRLRHPTWRGLRPDKTPADVGRESEPSKGPPGDGPPVPARARTAGARSQERLAARSRVGDRELSVTNLDKVLFPETGFTKGQLDRLLRPHRPGRCSPTLSGRPLTMKRFPDGVEGKFFFEKHVPSHSPRWVQDAEGPLRAPGRNQLRRRAGPAHPGLGGQPGHHRVPRPLVACVRPQEAPDQPRPDGVRPRPGRGDLHRRVLRRGRAHRGSPGRHASVRPGQDQRAEGTPALLLRARSISGWDDVRDEAHDLARQLESEHHDLVVSVMRKELRRGRVLIDWSQNHPAKTTVGVYSVRAMPQPMVSTPVTLDEVGRCARTGDPGLLRFDTEQVLARVARDGDLFAPRALAGAVKAKAKASQARPGPTVSQSDARPGSPRRPPPRWTPPRRGRTCAHRRAAAPSVASRMALAAQATGSSPPAA